MTAVSDPLLPADWSTVPERLTERVTSWPGSPLSVLMAALDQYAAAYYWYRSVVSHAHAEREAALVVQFERYLRDELAATDEQLADTRHYVQLVVGAGSVPPVMALPFRSFDGWLEGRRYA
jgi:hypothetical protein